MQLDLRELFGVGMPIAELMLRGTVIFWFLFSVFRFVLRRDVGGLSTADTLLLVLVADAAQNAMAGEYRTITEGLILLATILGWNLLLDFLSYRFRLFARFSTPRTVPLVRHGQFIMRSLRRQLLTPDEVMGKLREQGVTHVREVRHAWLEADGEVSVVRYPPGPRPEPPPASVFDERPP